MKVVGLLGSPWSTGLSSAIAGRFLEIAESLAAEVQTFDLHKLSFSRCQGCMTCKTLDECVLKDDLTEVFAAIRDADVLLMASPVHFGEVAYQLKAFIERTYCFVKPDFLINPQPSRLRPGKKLVFILTQKEPDESQFVDTYSRYEYFFRWCGFHDNHLIQASGESATGDVVASAEVMKLAEETAKRIVA